MSDSCVRPDLRLLHGFNDRRKAFAEEGLLASGEYAVHPEIAIPENPLGRGQTQAVRRVAADSDTPSVDAGFFLQVNGAPVPLKNLGFLLILSPRGYGRPCCHGRFPKVGIA